MAAEEKSKMPEWEEKILQDIIKAGLIHEKFSLSVSKRLLGALQSLSEIDSQLPQKLETIYTQTT